MWFKRRIARRVCQCCVTISDYFFSVWISISHLNLQATTKIRYLKKKVLNLCAKQSLGQTKPKPLTIRNPLLVVTQSHSISLYHTNIYIRVYVCPICTKLLWPFAGQPPNFPHNGTPNSEQCSKRPNTQNWNPTHCIFRLQHKKTIVYIFLPSFLKRSFHYDFHLQLPTTTNISIYIFLFPRFGWLKTQTIASTPSIKTTNNIQQKSLNTRIRRIR